MELFAADGHDAGGCERVTGKSGMRPDELQFHLEMKRQDLESRGLDRAAATLAARRALGNLPLTRDRVRDVWIAPWLQSVPQDYKLGLRMLLKYPGLSLAGGLALATAIGDWGRLVRLGG